MNAEPPVALIGMGCRFPGGGHGPDGFWNLLAAGDEAVRPFPKDRLGGSFYHPDPARIGRTHAVAGSFLDDVEDFDADFFGISPREAQFIDPMQRILLETSWEALEDAGQAPDKLAGSRTGVFVGIYATDFYSLQMSVGVDAFDAYTSPGTLHSMASGRLAHAFDLQGPAISVDTACSSSLVALHLAVNSLRREECDLALVGGVSLMLSPEIWVNLSLARMISGDGRCKTFDSRADGYGRGEGCGALVLKRLPDAIADRNRVLALVRGSAVKHDGRSASITAPNGVSQRAVIREALADAGLQPQEVTYVEAHGTGTPIGDPIEVEALQDVLSPPNAVGELLVGSVKTNIGHLEAAAGVAGVIKTVLAFEHRTIPAHLNLRELNPAIKLAKPRVRIPTSAEPWPSDQPHIAGVSAFGLSGTNAHVLLEAPPMPAQPEPPRETRPQVLLTISARTPTALAKLANDYAGCLRDGRVSLADLAYTANIGRSRLRHRAAVLAATTADATQQLSSLNKGADALDGPPRRLAFLYTGQGAQQAGMGRALYEDEPVFRAALDECAEAMADHLEVPLLDVLFGADPVGQLIHQTEYSQPALFAFQRALTALWESFGIRPDAVLGHSAGAYAAAYAANAFDLPTAAALVAARGRLMQRTEPGVMYTARAGISVVRAAMTGFEEAVAVAAVNAPDVIAISGEADAVEQVVLRLNADGVRTRRLNVSRAFHSPLMDSMLDDFDLSLAVIRKRELRTAFVSDTAGDFADSAELAEPDYWRRHVREPVRFADGLRTLAKAGCGLLVEVGPGTTLTSLARHVLAGSHTCVRASLGAASDESQSVHQTLAELFSRGAAIDFASYHSHRRGRLTRLPTYPFERLTLRNQVVERARERLETLATAGVDLGAHGRAVPYAGVPTWLPEGGAIFTSRLSEQQPQGAEDHRLFERIVVPAAHWIAAAAAAARFVHASTEQSKRSPGGNLTIEVCDIVFTLPLILTGPREHLVECRLSPDGTGQWKFDVHSAVEHDGAPTNWAQHAGATVRVTTASDSQPSTVDHRADPDSALIDGADFYRDISAMSLQLGPTFQWIERLTVAPERTLVKLRRPAAAERDSGTLPGFLDACYQAVARALPAVVVDTLLANDWLLVPVAIDRIRLEPAELSEGWCNLRLRGVSTAIPPQAVVDLEVHDDQNRPVVSIEGLRLATITARAITASQSMSRRYAIDWRPVEVETARPAGGGRWLLWSPVGESVDQVVAALRELGHACVVVAGRGATAQLLAPTVDPQPFDTDSVHAWTALANDPVADWTGLILLSTAPADCDDGVSESASLIRRLLPALQGWAASGGAPVRVVTRGAERVGQERPDVTQAAMRGFVRTFAAEHRSSFGGLVDLDPGADDTFDEMRDLAVLLAHSGDTANNDRRLAEPQLAMRGSSWLAPRLVAARWSASVATTVHPDAAYLITGGLGGLGMTFAKWLLDSGAGSVVLTGRSPLTGEARQALAGLDPTGTRLRYVPADVAAPVAADALFHRIGCDFPPLKGVIHAAGVLDDGVLQHQTWERVAKVLAPKVDGGWNLHCRTASMDLDFFVLFSSVAGVFGNAGQIGYAAANAFLDALAAYRRALGLPGLSIAWGPWSGDGMASSASVGDRLARAGLQPMRPEDAIREFADVVSEAGTLLVVEADWERWRHALEGPVADALLRELLGPASAVAGQRGIDVAALTALEPHEQLDRVMTELRAQVAATLQAASERVQVDASLASLGLDSLMSTQLRNQMEAVFNVPSLATMLQQGTSIRELAEQLVGWLPEGDKPR